jgi:hypothetical protein
MLRRLRRRGRGRRGGHLLPQRALQHILHGGGMGQLRSQLGYAP